MDTTFSWRMRWTRARKARADTPDVAHHLEQVLPAKEWLWALGSLCALHGRPFDAALMAREFPPPCNGHGLQLAASRLGLRMTPHWIPCGAAAPWLAQLSSLPRPFLLLSRPSGAAEDASSAPRLAIVTQTGPEGLVLFDALTNQPRQLNVQEGQARFMGLVWLCKPVADVPSDPELAEPGKFGFRWFVPELLRHRRVWRDVLLASLALQLIGLATPLFTQLIIDKVVVHRTESTLIAIGVAMGLMVIAGAALGWARQYLVLHTGNRVDAVLGSAVWSHALSLPLLFFQWRPTGVVAARMQGIETIREFISGAAISLVLDLPFLLICLALMLSYSPLLSAMCLATLVVIALLSALSAPVFQARLAQQFQHGARTQAFITEHLAGIETVKSLQMEPRLRQQHGDLLAAFLRSGFRARLVANNYQAAANALEQMMSLSVLMAGAWKVMSEPAFTIGMLVAFQMFASRLSQPMMRLVGLWAQFQQARLAVQRLGDIMDAPTEPYRLSPHRLAAATPGDIRITDLGFRHGPDLPLLYRHFELHIEPGACVAVMGPSGCGKSTLAKLLLGFLLPTEGQILIDGVDSRHMAANELRGGFGVVPQDTTLFSGTILDNLLSGNPSASLEQVIRVTRIAGLHTTIEALPQGYQTPIGERGAGLSGGQKQRLAIARALLKRPRILIFDEATSALDQATAEAFADTVNQLRGQVTMVFIAHALPANLHVDRILDLGAATGVCSAGQVARSTSIDTPVAAAGSATC